LTHVYTGRWTTWSTVHHGDMSSWVYRHHGRTSSQTDTGRWRCYCKVLTPWKLVQHCTEQLANRSQLLYKVHQTVMQTPEIQLFIQFYCSPFTVTHHIKNKVRNICKLSKKNQQLDFVSMVYAMTICVSVSV